MTYPSTIAKVALGVIGASTATVTGFGIHSALQDKTIGDAIITRGRKLINNKDVFEIAFKQRNVDDNFLALIGIQKASLETTTLEVGGVALSDWCNKNLKLDLTDDNIKAFLDNTEKYCSIPMMTMKEKMDKLGKKLAKDWKARLNAIKQWKTDKELEKVLATINKTIPSVKKDDHQQIWINALDHWCNEKVNSQLIHDKEDGIFNNMNKYCFEEESLQYHT